MELKNFIKNHFTQFKLQVFLKETLLKIIQRILSPYSRFFYSQTGEDILLFNLLNGEKNGFYVEVGCHKPIEKSNSFLFYKMNWKGICIDANERLIKEFQFQRPNDICINSAVSSKSGAVTFYEFEDSAVSTIDTNTIVEWKKKWKYKGEKSVESDTLTNILTNNNCPSHFEFLSIDVEGHDYEVLISLDLNRFEPKIIVIEIHETKVLDLANNKIFKYLIEFNYELIAFATMNAYFKKRF